MKKIKLGHRVKDIVSGIEGTVTGKTKWLTGCDTVHIEPVPDVNGRKQDGITLDINRVEFVNSDVRDKFVEMRKKAAEESKEEPKSNKDKGGPHDPIKHPNSL